MRRFVPLNYNKIIYIYIYLRILINFNLNLINNIELNTKTRQLVISAVQLNLVESKPSVQGVLASASGREAIGENLRRSDPNLHGKSSEVASATGIAL